MVWVSSPLIDVLGFRIMSIWYLFSKSIHQQRVYPLHWSEVKKWNEVTQSCPTLWDPMDCSLPGSSVHRIFQAKVLEWVAISFPRVSSQPRHWTWVSCMVGRCFTVWATRGPQPPGPNAWWSEVWMNEWKSFSCVWLFATPWTIQPMEFSRPEYWSG